MAISNGTLFHFLFAAYCNLSTKFFYLFTYSIKSELSASISSAHVALENPSAKIKPNNQYLTTPELNNPNSMEEINPKATAC
jgi:hypothetical protein